MACKHNAPRFSYCWQCDAMVFDKDSENKRGQAIVKCPDCAAKLRITSDYALPDDLVVEFVEHQE